MFVGGDVVEDRVDRLAGRDSNLDGVEEPDELTVPVALHATAEHGTRQDIKGSKQCRHAVTGVVMGLGGRVAGGEWPVEAGQPMTRTHDYKRHGTTTLFAALDVLEGKVIGRCMQRHRHQEFIRFLNTVEAAVPAGKIVHAVLDNYAVHKHSKVRAWLDRHPRWTFHFTPTSASWLNAVEGFFAKLAERRLRRGVFGSLVEVQAAIKRFIAESNGDPKPLGSVVA